MGAKRSEAPQCLSAAYASPLSNLGWPSADF